MAERFWPGPLTIILNKSKLIPMEVTAGLDTVGVRMPAHPVALKLISVSKVPIAAPSANISGRPSPTLAQHVIEDMDGRIPMILDGGKSDVGVESTVLDLTGHVPLVLRPGGVTVEMLESIVGQVNIHPNVMKPLQEGQRVLSPGMKYIHYAPKAPVTLIRGDLQRQVAFINEEVSKRSRKVSELVFLLLIRPLLTIRYKAVHGGQEAAGTTGGKFFCLPKEFDELNVDFILAGVDEKGEGLAVMNRIARAADFIL